MAEFINATLKAAGPGKVTLFSKTYCPYCARAKQALQAIGISPTVVELDERSDGAQIQNALFQMTGQRTVPSAWLNGKHIGGSDDVVTGVASGLFKDVPENGIKNISEFAGAEYAALQGFKTMSMQ